MVRLKNVEQKRGISLRVSLEIYEEMKAEVAARGPGYTMSDYIIYLHNFYYLRHLEDVPPQLRRIVTLGLDLRQIMQLSVLRSYLDTIMNWLGQR